MQILIQIDGDFVPMPKKHISRVQELAQTQFTLHQIQDSLLQEFGIKYAIQRVIGKIVTEDEKDDMKERYARWLAKRARREGLLDSSAVVVFKGSE